MFTAENDRFLVRVWRAEILECIFELGAVHSFVLETALERGYLVGLDPDHQWLVAAVACPFAELCATHSAIGVALE